MPQRILVIEDEIDIRELLGLMLTEMGFAVIEARDAYEGIARLHEDGADLIILDIMMPGMSGWELCRQIKDDPAISTIPILILTVPNPQRDAEAFPASGADAYLDKPFTRRALVARINGLLPVA